jgi:hypothetical protein
MTTTARTWTYVEPWVAQDPAKWERVGVGPFLREREVLIDVEVDGPARHCFACGGRVVLIRYTWPIEDQADPAAAQQPACKCTSWRHADGSPSHGAFAADLCPRPYCEGCAADVGPGHCPTCHGDGAPSTKPTGWYEDTTCPAPGCGSTDNRPGRTTPMASIPPLQKELLLSLRAGATLLYDSKRVYTRSTCWKLVRDGQYIGVARTATVEAALRKEWLAAPTGAKYTEALQLTETGAEIADQLAAADAAAPAAPRPEA